MRELSATSVCFLAGTLGQGGAERQLYYMLSALKQRNVRLKVLSLTRGEFWEEPIRRLGVPIVWVGQNSSRLARLGRIITVLRSDKPHVLQSQHFYTNLYAVGAARVLGVREIGALRSDAVNEVRDSGAVLGKLSLVTPRLIVANSGAAVRNAKALGLSGPRVHMLPNVVDATQFVPHSARRPGPINVLAAGRLGKEKRFDRLLSIAAAVRRDSRVPFRLTIIGDGPEQRRLEEQARRLALLPGIVEFRGRLASPAAAFRDADIFVLTSAFEGTPNVILEAMASGLPVVATNVGGVPEIVEDGVTGYLADPEDELSFGHAMARLLENEPLRLEMGGRARARVLADHSIDQLPGRLATIYEAAQS